MPINQFVVVLGILACYFLLLILVVLGLCRLLRLAAATPSIDQTPSNAWVVSENPRHPGIYRTRRSDMRRALCHMYWDGEGWYYLPTGKFKGYSTYHLAQHQEREWEFQTRAQANATCVSRGMA